MIKVASMTKAPFAVVGGLYLFGLSLCGAATAQDAAKPGTEEFGLTSRELVQTVNRVERLIARCMREQGFSYLPVDYLTVRKGMSADKKMPGLSEEEFLQQYGFGITTLYTGAAPQLATGYSPAKVGLGERNVQLYENLSTVDQVAYNRALFGDNSSVSFAVGLEIENFSQTGGCTRSAVEQVFTPEQLQATYYNPKDALINKDPRMKKAIKTYAKEMRAAGFNYDHPDEVEGDIRARLAALTAGGTIAVDQMTADQRAALDELNSFERQVAIKNEQLAEELFDPVEEQIEREMYAR